MNRRSAGPALLLGPIAIAFAAAPLAAKAQQAGKVYCIGYLSAPTRASVENGLQAFLRALRYHQSEHCQGSRPHDSVIGTGARGRSDSIVRRCELLFPSCASRPEE